MAMRGIDVQPRDLFSYIQLEQRVPSKHPLRAIRKMQDEQVGIAGDQSHRLAGQRQCQKLGALHVSTCVFGGLLAALRVKFPET